MGEISCRSSGAGHYTLRPSNGHNTLGDDGTFNCHFGSSRETCTASWGCNKTQAMALCCRDNPSCGNGVVDSVEELCDDGNSDDTDDCLSTCTWRLPTAHGLTGTGCY